MSKELIERLKSYIPNGDGHSSQYANDLADVVAILESKAAPVAYITGQFAGRCVIEAINRAAVLPTGMALYATPQPSAVPEGVRKVINYLSQSLHQASDGTVPCGEDAIVECIALLAAAPSAPATVQGDGWIPVSERLPESERTVLAFYLNSHGKGRRVRAEYIAAKTKSADDGWDSDEPADYDEQADEYFWPADWYEVMDNWDDLTHMVIHEGEVTHWMPLPAAPGAAPSAPKADDRPLYTCIGKGGEYRYLGTAIGAGDSRGELAEVYQDRTGQLFHRTPEDFMERMEPIAAARKGEGE